MRFSFGDVVLVPFPFSDQSTSKQRPATVISSETYHREHADVLLMAITSQARPAAATEVTVTRWQEAGLLRPSVINAAITTIEVRLVIKKLGHLANEDRAQLAALLRVILGE